MIRKIFLIVFLPIISVITCQIINHGIIGPIIIGDSCSYDVKGIKTGKIFDLFYEISSNTGYHPEPSLFNFYFTTGVGILIGGLISYKFLRRKIIIKKHETLTTPM